MSDAADFGPDFWKLFGRVLGRELAPGRYTRDDLPEWDSLRHIELVFELEQRFSLEIDGDAIVALYSDTDAILDFLTARAGRR